MSVALRRVLYGDGSAGEYTRAGVGARPPSTLATCWCPKCGRASTMNASVHSVDAAGNVTPSYVCPHRGCGFHDWVVLDGWSDS